MANHKKNEEEKEKQFSTGINELLMKEIKKISEYYGYSIATTIRKACKYMVKYHEKIMKEID